MIKNIYIYGCFYPLLTLFACQNNPPDTGTLPNNQSLTPQKVISRVDSLILNKTITVAYLTGQFEPAQDSLFELIDKPYAVRPLYIRKEAGLSFKKMYAAAQKDGIKLVINSATRNFKHQKNIWDSKWNGKKAVDGKKLPPVSKLAGKDRVLKILRWSAMPSTSRHHWGTDIDMNSADPKYWEKGKGLETFLWLQTHAAEYGFCQTYSDFGESRQTGYQVEKWHWSYLPLAKTFTEAYPRLINDSLIATFSFSGAETALELEIIKKYVQGINYLCQ